MFKLLKALNKADQGRREFPISPKKRSPRNAKNKRRREYCPVTIGNEYEVEISEIMPNGEGLAAIKGFWIFVPNVKVGDKVTVKVTTVDSVSADAKVVKRA